MTESSTRQSILDCLKEYSTPERPIYMVGGAVRDFLLQRPVHDLDFVVPGATRKLANDLACQLNGALYVMDEERDTTRVVLNLDEKERMIVDFATLRAADLEGDLRARDFTINAMAFDLAQPDRLIDPQGGLGDLREKRIRACSSASLSDDPLRVLRMVRQALTLGFRIDPETLSMARAGAVLLPRVSAERKRDELFRMLDGSRVALAIRLLDKIGALQYVLPELESLKGVEQSAPHTHNVWEHNLLVVEFLEQLLAPLVGRYREETAADPTTGSAVLWLGRYREQFAAHFQKYLVPDRSPRALLFLAALYHDIAKPETQAHMPAGKIRFLNHDEQGSKIISSRGSVLALSTTEISRLKVIVRQHMRVHHLTKSLQQPSETTRGEKLTRRLIYRYFRDIGDVGVDICLLSLADTRGTYGFTLPQALWEAQLETCRALLEAYWEKSEEVVSPHRLLTGSDLIETFGLEPGRVIGLLLDAIREGQATGEIHDQEEALTFSRNWLSQYNASQEVTHKSPEE